MRKHIIALSVASAFAVAATPRAEASAFALAEQGVSGLGNAFAGAAAVAEDASTVWWNPAGMSRLPSGKHVLFGAHIIMPKTEFNNRGSVPAALQPTGLGEGGDAGDTAIVPNFYYVMDLGPRWNFGVGVNVPFGLATEYDSDWIGRFQGIKSEVMTLNINPSVSYKVSDRASVGFGLSYQRGEIDLLSAVNYSAAAFNAGGAGLLTLIGGQGVEGRNSTGLDGDAWGFNIGALFDITPATRVGVHYRSSLEYEMDGTTSFSDVPAPLAASPLLSNGTVKLDLETPAALSFSAAHRMSDQLELLGDLTWTEWSRIDRLPLARTSGPLVGTPTGTIDTLVFNFDDTWRFSVGANYKWSGPWTLRAGVAFDQSPVPNAETRSVRLPDSDRTWLSLGASYQISRSGRIDAGYTFVNADDADINNTQAGKGTVRGTYEATVHILSVQYQHSF